MSRTDVLDKLSRVSRLSREQVLATFEEARENAKTLEACDVPHDFQPIPEEGQRIPRRHRCSKCGGVLNSAHVHWYNRGLKHGSPG